MKKFLPYIIIIFMFVGFFTFALKADAAGYCVNNEPYTSEEACRGVGGLWIESGASAAPSQGFSCQLAANPKLQNLLIYLTCIINRSVIPFIFALAIVMFVWGVVQFVINTDEEAKKEKGRQFMIWGIIALTVMVSVWGLVAILGNTFGINTHFIPQVKP